MANKWWQSAVVYQLYPRSFQDSNQDGIGDLVGVLPHLDYLQQLGVDVIWLNPIYRSPNADNGYDIADYQAIQPEFGTMADFTGVLHAIHAHGMKLMMDLVVNHTSTAHAWFQASRQDPTGPYGDDYIWRAGTPDTPPNNWRSEFGGSAWAWDDLRQQYYLHMYAESQPDLNWENPAVREAIYQMMTWWCEQGIDGFRMDVINLISKPISFADDASLKVDPHASSLRLVANGPKVAEYLREMNQRVLSHYDLITVGEAPWATPSDAAAYAGLSGGALQMIFQFEHMQLENDSDLGKWTTNRVALPALKRSLAKWQTALHGVAWNSLYWNNHDQPRVVSRFGNDSPQYRVRSAKLLANILHMMQGTPYIFQGEELGMTNWRAASLAEYDDVEIKNAYHELVETKHVLSAEQLLAAVHVRGRDSSRTPMQWDASPNAGFTTGKPWLTVNPNYLTINAKAALADSNSVYYFYQHLIKLRHDLLIISQGDFTLLAPADPAIFAYRRQWHDEALLVIGNFSAEPVAFPVSDYLTDSTDLIVTNAANSEVNRLLPYETRTYHLSV